MLEIWQAGENLVVTAIYALMLGIEKSKFIVHQPYAGGQFGGWDCGMGNQSKHVPVAALLAKKTNAPIKVIYHCKDDQYAEMDEATADIKVGYKKDGTITAVEIKAKAANMLDMSFLPETCGGGHFLESTKIPNVQGVATTVFVNKHNFGPSRCEQQLNAHVKQQVFTRVAAAIGTDEGTIALINEGQEGIPMADIDEYKSANKIPLIDSYATVLHWQSRWWASTRSSMRRVRRSSPMASITACALRLTMSSVTAGR
jgi:CO/xanthine dehydrogenase Mo-binding subunit